MKRRTFLKRASLAPGISLLTIPFCSHIKTKNPNIVLIVSDDQGWGDVHSHNNLNINTPTLDKLAADGARFERFYVSPVCAPTRASLLTGRYHLRTGTSWVTHGKEIMREGEITLAEVLKNNGYKTGCFGKWHNGSYYPVNPNGQGFDEFIGFCSGHMNNYFDSMLLSNNDEIEFDGYITDFLTNKAISFIKENKDNPFLCYIPYNAPHSPFQVPDKYYEKYRQKGYSDDTACVYGMVENMDENIGRILECLDQNKLSENTLVLFLSDNGPNTDRYNDNMRGRKASVHEGGVRVPFFIKWPGKIPEKLIIKQICGHIDIFPTILEICQIKPPENVFIDGKSLVPLIMEQTEEWPERTLYTHHSASGKVELFPGSARTQQYRLIVDKDQIELYDMIADPEEKKDISGTSSEIAKKIFKDYKMWFADVTQNLPEFPFYVPVGYTHTKRVTLLATEAEYLGNVEFQGGMGWANDWFINWKDPKDKILWNIKIVSDNDYSFSLLYNCSEADTGTEICLNIGGKEVTCTIREAFLQDPVFSPDRVKRQEVYEKKWADMQIGSIALGKGNYQLSLNTKNKAKGNGIEVKGVVILRK